MAGAEGGSGMAGHSAGRGDLEIQLTGERENRLRGYESRVNNEGMVSITRVGDNVPVTALEGVEVR